MADRALLGTRKGLFELQRSKDKSWQIAASSFLGDPVTMLLSDARDGALYAALNLGHFGVKLQRRDAGAMDWTEVAVPAYPPQPASDPEQPDVAWKLSLIWALAPGGIDEPGVLWAGTLPGGLFRSGDRGDSWQLVDALWTMPQRREWVGGGYDVPGIHSICVDPRDSRHVLVGVSCGGAWVTRDGGASWAASSAGMRASYMPPEREADPNIQDPHRIVQCGAAPDVLWCQHHCGIWRATDGGANWLRLGQHDTVSDFGFAVAVHPRDPDCAWFVPAAADQKRIPVAAALSVSRTRDGGQSFQSLRSGLPQTHCYDLIYRHGLAVDHDGRSLMMGSTSGGLWSSDDGGDHWQTVSHTLPPIYALQFG